MWRKKISFLYFRNISESKSWFIFLGVILSKTQKGKIIFQEFWRHSKHVWWFKDLWTVNWKYVSNEHLKDLTSLSYSEKKKMKKAKNFYVIKTVHVSYVGTWLYSMALRSGVLNSWKVAIHRFGDQTN